MINIEQVGGSGIKLFGRDKDGKRTIEVINNFKPYFYNEKKEKVEVDSTGDVEIQRNLCDETYEADVVFTNRVLIDRFKTPLKEEPLRVCTLDIETNMCVDTENTPEPVLCLTVHDSSTNIYDTFVTMFDKMTADEQRKLIESFPKNHVVRAFNTEELMLTSFIVFIKELDPDIIPVFYNRKEFDMRYLINRCDKLKLPIKRISPTGVARIDKRGNVKVGGRVIFDILFAYKKLVSGELQENSLEFVANEVLGTGKLLSGDKTLADVIRTKDIKALIEYNKRDVELCVEIIKKRRLIEFFDTMRRVAGCNWDTTKYFGSLADILSLREAKKRGVILKTKVYKKDKKVEKVEKFEGADVMEPKIGVYKNVYVLDLKSLYPSLICQFNIGFDSIVGDGNVVGGNYTKIGKHTFTTSNECIMGTVIKRLWKDRERYKDLMNKSEYGSDDYKSYYSIQYAIKFLLNSLYGYTGYEYSRVYDRRVAESVTEAGRDCIRWVRKVVTEHGGNIIKSDTDSVYIKAKSDELEGILKEANYMVNLIDESFNDFVPKYNVRKNEYLNINFESVYSSVFVFVKKKDAGWLIYDGVKLKEPKFKVTGFEMKKADYNKFGKKIQEKLIKLLLDSKDKTFIDKYIRKKCRLLKSADLSDLAMSKTLKKNIKEYKVKTHVIKGIENNKKEKFMIGDRFWLIYTKTVDGSAVDVYCYKEKPNNVVLNIKKMKEVTILNKVNNIYDALGWGEFTEDTGLAKWLS